MAYSLGCGKGYVETGPQSTFMASIIMEAVPCVKFIHCVRDPRHVVRSAMRRRWYDGSPCDGTRIVPHANAAFARRWNTCTRFQKNLWLWDETNRWIIDFFSRLPEDSGLALRSEDVFANHEETIRKLFAFVGARMAPKWEIGRVLRKRLNLQETGDFPEFSAWSRDMRSEFTNACGDTARYLGYDPSVDLP